MTRAERTYDAIHKQALQDYRRKCVAAYEEFKSMCKTARNEYTRLSSQDVQSSNITRSKLCDLY